MLLALFPSRDGNRLNVLLSRRSWELKSYVSNSNLVLGPVYE